MVSRCCFQNPLTRQDFTIDDCRRLDAYLEEYCYSTSRAGMKSGNATGSNPASVQDPRHTTSTSRKISVTEAFILNQSIQVGRNRHGGGPRRPPSSVDADRMQTLRNTATVALAGLFVWDSRMSGSNIESTSHETSDNGLLDWGFNLHRQVDDTSIAPDDGDGWFNIVDDDEAIVVGSHRDQYDRVQAAFPPLQGTENHSTSSSGVDTVVQDQHLIECVRDASKREEERKRAHALRLEAARRQLLQNALRAREERRRQNKERLRQGLVEYQRKKMESEEIQRTRDEIAAWREDQWEKLQLLSDMKKQEELEARRKQDQEIKEKQTANDTDTDEADKDVTAEAERQEKKKASAAAKRKKAKDKKKKEKLEKRIADEALQRRKEVEAKKAAATVKCAGCGQGIVDSGFEKFNFRFCSTKCARAAKPLSSDLSR